MTAVVEGTTRALGMGRLLPPLSAVERGSTLVHAAPIELVPFPPYGPEDFITYPRLTALCGVRGWGDAGGAGTTETVTCRRCLRVLSAAERAEAASAGHASARSSSETVSTPTRRSVLS